jgi:hypothetical protein
VLRADLPRGQLPIGAAERDLAARLGGCWWDPRRVEAGLDAEADKTTRPRLAKGSLTDAMSNARPSEPVACSHSAGVPSSHSFTGSSPPSLCAGARDRSSSGTCVDRYELVVDDQNGSCVCQGPRGSRCFLTGDARQV